MHENEQINTFEFDPRSNLDESEQRHEFGLQQEARKISADAQSKIDREAELLAARTDHDAIARDAIHKHSAYEDTPQARGAREMAKRQAHVAHLATKAGAEEQAAEAKAAMQAAADEVIAAEHAVDLQNAASVDRVAKAHEQLSRAKMIHKACANRASATK